MSLCGATKNSHVNIAKWLAPMFHDWQLSQTYVLQRCVIAACTGSAPNRDQ